MVLSSWVVLVLAVGAPVMAPEPYEDLDLLEETLRLEHPGAGVAAEERWYSLIAASATLLMGSGLALSPWISAPGRNPILAPPPAGRVVPGLLFGLAIVAVAPSIPDLLYGGMGNFLLRSGVRAALLGLTLLLLPAAPLALVTGLAATALTAYDLFAAPDAPRRARERAAAG